MEAGSKHSDCLTVAQAPEASDPRRRAQKELLDIAEECKAPNWDGAGANAVKPETCKSAHLFLSAIPEGFPLPTLGVEPDGQVTLEWHRSLTRTVSISVSPEGELHYAALIGPARHYGCEPFSGEIPDQIASLIRKVI